MEVTIAH